MVCMSSRRPPAPRGRSEERLERQSSQPRQPNQRPSGRGSGDPINNENSAPKRNFGWRRSRKVDEPANTGTPRPSRAQAAARNQSTGRGQSWHIVWDAGQKSHQISLRLIAIVAFAALAVIIVLTPLRGYVNQQEEKRQLQSQLEASKAHVEELEQEIALWNDPQYVQAQARDRLGYVMPGQTLYTVVGSGDDTQLTPEERVVQANERRRALTPFYITLWDALHVADLSDTEGNPQNVPVIGEDS